MPQVVPGNTLEETVEEEMWRNERTVVSMRAGHFPLPYDFARLDHQPTIPEVVLEEVVSRMRQHHTQDNKALIKSEFGKIRLAVAAPLETYLQQAYLYGVSGSAYLKWPGNTLEETVEEEMRRNERTVVSMRAGHFPLPYDFARLDHQPTTPEVVAFSACYL
ncbi:hypothetical protein MTO96_032186 [Rhipicephalus appendiculatus]